MTGGHSLVRISFQSDSTVLLGKVFIWDISYQWVVLKAIIVLEKAQVCPGTYVRREK